MTKRSIIGLITALILLLCALLWWRSKNGEEKQSKGPLGKAPHSGPPLLGKDLTVKDRMELFSKAIQFHDLPLSGKVVDENGGPVAGATVVYGVSRGYEKGTRGSAITDDKGDFSIKGQRGGSMAVEAQHPNYVTINDSRKVFQSLDSFLANLPQTDYVTLVLRKKLPEQNLIFLSNRVMYHCASGTGVVYYDLKSRNLVAAESPSTLRIRTEVAPANEQTGLYNWSLTAEVPEGLVRVKTDPYLFEAPADGYLPSFKMVESESDPDWKISGEASLFVKLKTGEFGVVDLTFSSRSSEGSIWASALNPEPGNRNLTPKADR